MAEKDEAVVSVMETQMLRWCLGVKRFGCITAEAVKKFKEVAAIKDKLRERLS